ncbi:MAG: hypothetical protein Sapg2KO_13180 [Saprospiraceae bacterium]
MRLQIIFISLLFTTTLWAQITPENRWGITAGWTEAAIGDQHISPLLYQSDVLNVGGLFQHRGQTFIEVSLKFGIGTNQAQNLRYRKGTFKETPDFYGEVESYDYVVNPFFSSFNGAFQLKLLWQIGTHHQLGVRANTRYWLTGKAGDTWQYAQFDIGPSYQYSYPIFKGHIQADVDLPLLAYVVRPNYGVDPSLSDETNYFKGFLRTGASWATINEFINPNIRVGYLHQFQNGKELGAYYKLRWTSFPEPRPVRIFEHGFDLVYFF